MHANTLEAYRYWRRRGVAALSALSRAREDTANNKRRYTSASFIRESAWNPPCSHWGGKHCRWVEDTERAGLRRVGTYDEIMRANDRRAGHLGWFVNEFCDETAVPVVFRLPARNGQSVFAYGYDDWNNKGAAFLCFDNDAEDEIEAARYADGLTERMAEEERAYQEAWQAGARFVDLAEEIKTAREQIRALLGELRTIVIPANSVTCATLRASIQREFREINAARKTRAKLFSEFGHAAGFNEH
jgi:hypothetical protein